MAQRKNKKAGGIISLLTLVAFVCYLAFFQNRKDDTAAPPAVEAPAKTGKPPKDATPRNLTTFTGKVTGIKDGDTFEVLYEGQPERVRLAEIDCPEKSQPFGNNAKQFASGLCFGKTVTVSSGGTRDRYGRVVGTVTLEDGTNVNEALIKAGMAWHYKQYSDNEALGALEQQARLMRVGLWADKDPTPPWEWRKNKRKRKPYRHRSAA